MSARKKAVVGQFIADGLLFSTLAGVSLLIGIRSVVRGARAIGLLPPKAESVVG
jgi:hypothetical protein